MDPVPSPRASSPVASVPRRARARTATLPTTPRFAATGRASTSGYAAASQVAQVRSGFLLFLVLSALILGISGCAERDNPFDPANRPANPWEEFVPTPAPGHLVFDPSVPAEPPYRYQDLHAAFSAVKPGDTLWIRGPRDYALEKSIRLEGYRGNSDLPIVVRPYGGAVRFSKHTQQDYSPLLEIHGEAANISFEHLTFGPSSKGDGVAIYGPTQPVWFRHCVFEKNAELGVYIQATHPGSDPANPDVELPYPTRLYLEDVLFHDNGRSTRKSAGIYKSQLGVVPDNPDIIDTVGVTFTVE